MPSAVAWAISRRDRYARAADAVCSSVAATGPSTRLRSSMVHVQDPPRSCCPDDLLADPTDDTCGFSITTYVAAVVVHRDLRYPRGLAAGRPSARATHAVVVRHHLGERRTLPSWKYGGCRQSAQRSGTPRCRSAPRMRRQHRCRRRVNDAVVAVGADPPMWQVAHDFNSRPPRVAAAVSTPRAEEGRSAVLIRAQAASFATTSGECLTSMPSRGSESCRARPSGSRRRTHSNTRSALPR
jgi:hypothetical protein